MFNKPVSTIIFTALVISPTLNPAYADNGNVRRSQQQRSVIQTTEAQNPRRRQQGGRQIQQTLDGYGNNPRYPEQGASGQLYKRIVPAKYADGIGEIIDGPELRYLSNRIFADGSQNFFSENSVTQWAYNWGQFIDHSIGLRMSGSEVVEVAFDESDPLENFTNSAENLAVTRSATAPGSGVTTPREHVNTVSSYIDAWAVYGGSEERLEWLREGPVDGDPGNNGAKLMLTPDGYLPVASQRGDAASAPLMERVGMLRAVPDADDLVVVAGDIRANENIALTAVQTLFAREHNRIVDRLPESMSEQGKFDLARQLVIATQQYITYNEFLPAVGVYLEEPSGYKPDVDVTVTHEFATVGYRAHSMIHGEIEIEAPGTQFTESALQSLASQGIEIESVGDGIELAVPLNIAFANPQLLPQLGLGAVSAGLGGEPQYNNDETIDNQLRSVLFQLPNPAIADPDACLDGPELPHCFLLASDVGVLDVFRARDHGIADYNTLRVAYGLPAVNSFSELTGENTEEFPVSDEFVSTVDPINDPDIMAFIELRDINGKLLTPGSEEADSAAVTGTRRSTLAARLKAIYGSVDNVDAFVGMVSEPHVIGSELGELQLVMWEKQFRALRDGDRHFYLWNKSLRRNMRKLRGTGLTYKQSLADVVVNNTDLSAADIQANLFVVDPG